MKRLINWLDQLVNLVAIASMLTMVILVFMNVVLRYAFDSGLPWSEEASRIAFVWVVFLGIIIANRDNSHLRVDIIVSRLGNIGQKITGAIAGIVIVLVLISVLIGGSKLIALTHAQGLPATGIPTSVIYIAGVISCSILLIGIVAKVFKKKEKQQ
ncbi:TRAP transporter small permease [Vibrio sp. Hep-1b-8]|uniref:TRAP transporter small permease n=1 Tax=Vibrio sp. Hep-1b-8 TaxID=2144187 RepID=UPI0011106632|nr:TRAP transporter small permease [Vibrio sp. Hep-1b-8]TMX42108.1 TRAP transporter small permease [Vibrio sp. Hep-1b-8]